MIYDFPMRKFRSKRINFVNSFKEETSLGGQ